MMVVLFFFSSSLIIIVSVPSLVCGSTKNDLSLLLFVKKPIPPPTLSLTLSFILHQLCLLLYLLFLFYFNGVSHKATISRGLFKRICFGEFIFDLIPLALEYIALIFLSGVFIRFFGFF